MTLKFSPALLLLGLTLQACSSSVAGPIEAKHYQSKHYETTRYGTHYEGASQSYGAYSLQNAQGLQGNCGVSLHACGYVTQMYAVPAPVMAAPEISAPAPVQPTWTQTPAAPVYHTPATPLESVLPPLPSTPYIAPTYPSAPDTYTQDYRPYRK